MWRPPASKEAATVDSTVDACERARMPAVVARLYRYPVKGLSAESLPAVSLLPDRGLPLDRAFALALSPAAADPGRPGWLPKNHFATLVRHERLAALDARYDADTGVLALHRNGRKVAQGAIGTPIGRAMIEDFFRAYLKNEVAAPPRLVGSVDGPMLSDCAEPGLSMIGLASIKDIERVVGRPLDPLRFRANLYLEGTAPWEEFGWVGREVVLGSARLRVTERLARCAATDVEPGTGVRDMSIPRSLMGGFGHCDCGVFATVVEAGNVAPGDRIEPADA
jgi:uncharacterized protein